METLGRRRTTSWWRDRVRRPEDNRVLRVARRWAHQGEGGMVELIRDAIQARGLIRGGILHRGGELWEGERDLEAIMSGRGEAGQPIQEMREIGGIRVKGSTGARHLEDGGEERKDFSLHTSSIRDVGTSGGRFDDLEANRTALVPLSGHMEEPPPP
jgi:hypothetical protein